MCGREKRSAGRTRCCQLILAFLTASGAAFGQTVTRVSESPTGVGGNAESRRPSISADGRFVAFTSKADNLVAGDIDLVADVFVYDRDSGTVELITWGVGGVPADGKSDRPTISADGRFVAFYSDATNLIPDDTNGKRDIFVYDRTARTTELVSIGTDGRHGDKSSNMPSISADGRYIAFRSNATTLVSSDFNGVRDIFVRDRDPDQNGVFDEGNGTTIRVSVSTGGEPGDAESDRPVISADGNFVAFFSDAGNLVDGDVPTFDRLLCPSCTGVRDVFVHDRTTGKTERVSIATDGTPGNGASSRPAISADGRYVAFRSGASNLIGNDANGADDVFLRDRANVTTVRVSIASDGSEANGASSVPSMSSDGRFIAFRSVATNLAALGAGAGFEQVYLYDRDRSIVTLVSTNLAGAAGDGDSSRPVVSADGSVVAFHSLAADLVPGDANGFQDVFVRVVDASSGSPDSDGDGVPDAQDNCPTVGNASQSDLDGDGLGDACDDDRDGDGTPNASDECPDDPNKIKVGVCGCGTPDTDDGQGGVVCVDGCPNDPDKTAPGVCGCGFPDIDDGNGNIVCEDACPNDPNKTAPGVCGCGQSEEDSDGDGTPDCNDHCPDSPFKIEPGECGCQKLDTDVDGDGVPNCIDNCNAIPNADQADADGNGIGDACDDTTPPDNGGATGNNDPGNGAGEGGNTGQSVPGDGTVDSPAPVSPCGAMGMVPMLFCFLGLTTLKRRR